MRNLVFMVTITLFATAVIPLNAFAAPQTAKSIQQCATLLPKGKSYTYSIKGTINTTGTKLNMHGSFTVSEVNSKNVAIGATDTEAFADCVKTLIKGKPF